MRLVCFEHTVVADLTPRLSAASSLENAFEEFTPIYENVSAIRPDSQPKPAS